MSSNVVTVPDGTIASEGVKSKGVTLSNAVWGCFVNSRNVCPLACYGFRICLCSAFATQTMFTFTFHTHPNPYKIPFVPSTSARMSWGMPPVISARSSVASLTFTNSTFTNASANRVQALSMRT